MAKTPKPAPAPEGDVIVEVRDALNRDGESFAPGDIASLPAAEATVLRALGVVNFDDAAATAPAASQT